MSIIFGPSDNELFPFLLAWIYLYFAFIFEEYFLWIEFEAFLLVNFYFFDGLAGEEPDFRIYICVSNFQHLTSIYLSITLERKACDL